ncbi:hypothetical protein [Aquihabitans sp. McL0605]|uniref:hypothetical protein n=1 Tax=Aquihabitans sp. McL0605 TaxID=3415671 RepID=UPI003CF60EA4
MLNAEIQAHLEAGSSEVIGLVGADGRPYATRGWGMRVLDAQAGTVRVLVREVDLQPLGLSAGAEPDVAIALTATDVPTLFSLQLKGRLEAVEAAAAADVAIVERYCDQFIDDVVGIDHFSRELMDRWRPSGTMVACRIRVDELFGQTPGPDAGARLSRT